jgi:hypothetical protein
VRRGTRSNCHPSLAKPPNREEDVTAAKTMIVDGSRVKSYHWHVITSEN